MSKKKAGKRLDRLIKAGICPVDDVSEYASELRQSAERMVDEKSIRKQCRFFKALGDETRLRILTILQMREMCVCEIMVALELTQPTASHHLGILENAGLVESRKEGKWVFYRIADQELISRIGNLKIEQGRKGFRAGIS